MSVVSDESDKPHTKNMRDGELAISEMGFSCGQLKEAESGPRRIYWLFIGFQVASCLHLRVCGEFTCVTGVMEGSMAG
jgi:hypothetical protein